MKPDTQEATSSASRILDRLIKTLKSRSFKNRISVAFYSSGPIGALAQSVASAKQCKGRSDCPVTGTWRDVKTKLRVAEKTVDVIDYVMRDLVTTWISPYDTKSGRAWTKAKVVGVSLLSTTLSGMFDSILYQIGDEVRARLHVKLRKAAKLHYADEVGRAWRAGDDDMDLEGMFLEEAKRTDPVSSLISYILNMYAKALKRSKSKLPSLARERMREAVSSDLVNRVLSVDSVDDAISKMIVEEKDDLSSATDR
jgi:hypothetical protein